MLENLPLDPFKKLVSFWSARFCIPVDERDDILHDALILYAESDVFQGHKHGMSKAVLKACKRFRGRPSIHIRDPDLIWSTNDMCVPCTSPLQKFVEHNIAKLSKPERNLLDAVRETDWIDSAELCSRLKLKPNSLATLKHNLKSRLNILRRNTIYLASEFWTTSNDYSGLDLCVDLEEREDVATLLAYFHALRFLRELPASNSESLDRGLARLRLYFLEALRLRQKNQRHWLLLSHCHTNATNTCLELFAEQSSFHAYLNITNDHMQVAHEIESRAEVERRRALLWDFSCIRIAGAFADVLHNETLRARFEH